MTQLTTNSSVKPSAQVKRQAERGENCSLEPLAGRYPSPGQECTLNSRGDFFMEHEARAFIGAPCVVVKRTKAGLVQVALKSDPAKKYSAPLRNVTLTPNAQANRKTGHE